MPVRQMRTAVSRPLPAARTAQKAQTARPGSHLPVELRSRMERAFGTDLSEVRVHVGSRAAGVAALAFTQGSDIHFRPGEYRPDTPFGQALIGHELTHVVQQRSGRVPGGSGVHEDAALEREAHEAGLRAASGESVRPAGAIAPGEVADGAAPIQRMPEAVEDFLRFLGLIGPHDPSADPQRKRRYNLVPDLLDTAKGHARHERETLEGVASARWAAMRAGDRHQQAAAEAQLTQALGRLFALAEAYPAMKADPSYQALHDEIEELGYRIR